MFENPPKPPVRKESTLERAFIKWCSQVGLRQKKLAINGERSYPDRTVFLGSGRICCIELKAPKGKPTEGQLRCKEWLEEEGIPVLISNNLEEIIEWVLFLKNNWTSPSSGSHTLIRQLPPSS